MSDLISRQALCEYALSQKDKSITPNEIMRFPPVAGMTVAEYRERMIEAFHNADCDNLIAVVVLPTEKEFQQLEWLLKKEYVPFLEKVNKALKAKQWIPVSEKLPKYSDSVLVSLFDGEIDIGSYYCDTWHINGCGSVEDGAVIAWMPLPKSYEVEE